MSGRGLLCYYNAMPATANRRDGHVLLVDSELETRRGLESPAARHCRGHLPRHPRPACSNPRRASVATPGPGRGKPSRGPCSGSTAASQPRLPRRAAAAATHWASAQPTRTAARRRNPACGRAAALGPRRAPRRLPARSRAERSLSVRGRTRPPPFSRKRTSARGPASRLGYRAALLNQSALPKTPPRSPAAAAPARRAAAGAGATWPGPGRSICGRAPWPAPATTRAGP